MPKKKKLKCSNVYGSCICCNYHGLIDLHHVKTQGSGGTDKSHNIMHLCRSCHQTIQGRLAQVASKNYKVRNWLKENGWYFEAFLGKWKHPEENGMSKINDKYDFTQLDDEKVEN